MRKITLLTIALLSLLSPLTAQMQDGKKTFPTRISLRSTNDSILLGWREAETEVKGYNVYRFSEPIDADNIDKAQLIATVDAGKGEYEDFPPFEEVPYFYAILAVDPDEKEQQIFVPFSNVNLYGVTVLYTQRASTEVASLSRITASAEPPGISLTFQADRGEREMLVYRHTSPILEPADLIKAILIGRVLSGTGVFRDTPISGVAYYYAVLDSQTLLSGNIDLAPGKNTTQKAAALPFQDRGGPTLPANFALRPRPLPYLSSEELYSRREGDPQPVTARPLAAETKKKVDNLLKGYKGRPELALMPLLLPEDRTSASEHQDPRLLAILNQELLPGHWQSARALLSNYARLPRPSTVRHRLHYYQGQAAYFEGDYQEALMSFLFAEEYYHRESQPWIWMIIRKIMETES